MRPSATTSRAVLPPNVAIGSSSQTIAFHDHPISPQLFAGHVSQLDDRGWPHITKKNKASDVQKSLTPLEELITFKDHYS
jgi:hypothetical protein